MKNLIEFYHGLVLDFKFVTKFDSLYYYYVIVFQLAVLRADYERMKGENQRLKETLNQVTTNYNALQMHLVTFKPKKTEENGMPDGKVEGKDIVVPRQFMDLRLATNGDADENSLSSSEVRSHERSGSPGTNGEVKASKEGIVFDQDKKELHLHGCKTGREDSPDQGWAANNKLPRFNSPKDHVDQTEATMRKARVSVRARSEAAMVCYHCKNID